MSRHHVVLTDGGFRMSLSMVRVVKERIGRKGENWYELDSFLSKARRVYRCLCGKSKRGEEVFRHERLVCLICWMV